MHQPFSGSLVQFLLLVSLDSAVTCGVCHAGEHDALLHLVVVKERLVALIDLAGLQKLTFRSWKIQKDETRSRAYSAWRSV